MSVGSDFGMLRNDMRDIRRFRVARFFRVWRRFFAI